MLDRGYFYQFSWLLEILLSVANNRA